MVLPALHAMQGRVRDANTLRKLRVGKVSAFLLEESSKLAVQVPAHGRTVANKSSRMRDDFALQGRRVVAHYT